MAQRITSRNNPRLKEVARLVASSRDRRKARKCVLEGEHLVAVYAARYGPPELVIVADEALARAPIRDLAERHSDRTLIVSIAGRRQLSRRPRRSTRFLHCQPSGPLCAIYASLFVSCDARPKRDF